MKHCVFLVTAILMTLSLGAAPPAAPHHNYVRRLPKAEGGVKFADFAMRPRSHARSVNEAGGHPAMADARFRLSTNPFSAQTLKAPDGTDLLGAITYDDTWGWNSREGLYNISTTSASGISLHKETNINGAAFYADGAVYTPYVEDWGFMVLRNFLRIDPQTGKFETVNTEFTDRYEIFSAAWLPKRNYALAYGLNASKNPMLLKLDLLGNVSELAPLDASMNFTGGLCVDAAGKVYGMSSAGDLYTISLSDYSCSKIGSTGVSTLYATALCFDNDRDIIYYTTCYEEAVSGFYTIDPATGAATKRYDFNSCLQVRMLHLPEAAAAADAPGAPRDVEILFPDGGLSGTLSFLPPAVTYAGTPAQGELSYFVDIDGMQAATGTTSYGAERVTVPVSVNAAGNHIFRVYCSNAAGDGEDFSVTAYIGPDVPLPVENVTLSYADGRLNLSWDPLKGEKGGFIDQSKVTYTIIRTDGLTSDEVAYGHKNTSFSEVFPEPAGHVSVIKYSVKAVYNGVITDPVFSNKVMLGYIAPPLDENFATVAAFESQFMEVDNNGDGKTWMYDDTKGTGAVSYRYHSDNNGDDYLVLPAMKLTKGKIYFFSFLAGATNEGNPERIAAYVGKAPTAEALNIELVKPTVIEPPLMLVDGQVTGVPFESRFVPEEDGIYYFAIKACSDPYMYRLFVTDIHVSAPLSTASPGPVTALALTADSEGEPVVDIEFDAPKVDINGDPLSALGKIEVYRGDELVETVTPAIGAHVKVTDREAGEGEVTYTVIPSNEYGDGIAQSATVFVGFNVPVAPAWVNVESGSDYGEVVVSWSPVTEDINGLTLPEVAYRVCMYDENKRDWVTVDNDLEETSCKVRVCDPEAEQNFAQLAVHAVNYTGESTRRAASVICVGRPYSMPYFESFRQNTLLGIQTLAGGGGWVGANDNTFTDLTSQDGDGAFAVFMGGQAGDSSRLFTGRIHIDEDAENPEFSFYYFCTSPIDKNSIQVVVDEGSGYIDLGEPFFAGSGSSLEWNRVSLDLSRYRGKDVQLGIQVTMGAGTQGTAFDNFSVKNQPEHDLAAEVRVASSSVKPGDRLGIQAQVLNYGKVAEQRFSVDLLINGKVVDTKEGSLINAGEKQAVLFEYELSPASPETLTVGVHVNCDVNDGNWDNNFSPLAKVDVILPDYPAVTDLSGAKGEAGEVLLSWNEPDYGGIYIRTTETFEEADPFATMNVGNTCGWTFLDRDGGPVGGMQGLEIPNVPDSRPASFFILDASAEGFNASFSVHGGSKCLAAIFNVDQSTNDDWAISPELCGEAQTISFYARAYEMSLPEKIEILYSSTDTDPQSFTSVKTISGISTDRQLTWTRCSADLPAGAKYFAIRYISTNTFMVMIDDITYIPAGSAMLALEGYNVYRNGIRINSELVKAKEFTDFEPGEGPGYVVTAVYNTGESRASNEIFPLGGSVGTVGDAVTVRGLRGAIEVRGTDLCVTVADMQGRLIHRGEAGIIPASPGVYIVHFGRKAAKVIVK